MNILTHFKLQADPMMVGAPLDQTAQVSFNLALGEGTDKFVYQRAILEEKKSGDTLDTVLRSHKKAPNGAGL